MCFGTFDGLHQGHLSYFKQAKKLGDCLMVVVARDINVEKIKGRLPRQNEQIRLNAVAKLSFINEVCLGNAKDRMAVIRKFKPDVIALGYDQEADTEKLQAEFPDIKIVRLKAYQPEKYKSSLMR